MTTDVNTVLTSDDMIIGYRNIDNMTQIAGAYREFFQRKEEEFIKSGEHVDVMYGAVYDEFVKAARNVAIGIDDTDALWKFEHAVMTYWTAKRISDVQDGYVAERQDDLERVNAFCDALIAARESYVKARQDRESLDFASDELTE